MAVSQDFYRDRSCMPREEYRGARFWKGCFDSGAGNRFGKAFVERIGYRSWLLHEAACDLHYRPFGQTMRFRRWSR